MKFRKWVKVIFLFLCLAIVIIATEERRSRRLCQQLLIDIDNRYENYFVDEKEVQMLLTDAGSKEVVGIPYPELNLKELEQRVETNKYIRRAQVYRDVRGNLLVYAQQNRPVARLLRSGAPDAYISDEGEVLPVSDKYTARVMVVSGAYVERLVRQEADERTKSQQVFELISFVDKNEFWRAQIAQIDIDKEGEVILYPQVGKQRIEFGEANNISEKFNKLDIFYEQVLPRKGWNYYSRVDLKYKDQIVCD